ncbi:MAG: hypothetical protein ETSY2_41925 [Candidatus Entotheonella gemina]|uniref:PIN domain-containing protein n=1 Tax=Candidatus Entotheonella gemina TaxID=1429439 RepID=W4LLZ8_9BACT|nr:MAG: hypothetical protein ETSY2_41925 [Candidatus Entotheonella gemina]
MTESETPFYFFDTSALLKRYHPEIGSEVVDAVFDLAVAVRVISDISIIEIYSAFARHVRVGDVTREDFQAAKLELDSDIQDGRLLVIALSDADKAEAASLIESHGMTRALRTLDALHLAVMKRLGAARIHAVYCADQSLSAVLSAEGFNVIDPEAPPASDT